MRIGSDVNIPVWSIALVREAKMPVAKKRSKLVPPESASSAAAADGESARRAPRHPEGGGVKMDRT